MQTRKETAFHLFLLCPFGGVRFNGQSLRANNLLAEAWDRLMGIQLVKDQGYSQIWEDYSDSLTTLVKWINDDTSSVCWTEAQKYGSENLMYELERLFTI